MNLLNIAAGVGDRVSTYCLLRKPKDIFILNLGDNAHMFQPAALADPEGVGW